MGHLDFKSIGGFVGSGSIITVGVFTLNSIAIIIGILAGLTTIGWNVINSYFKIKESKRSKQEARGEINNE